MRVINNGQCVIVSASDIRKLKPCRDGFKAFKRKAPKGLVLSLDPEQNLPLAQRLMAPFGSLAVLGSTWFINRVVPRFNNDRRNVSYECPDKAWLLAQSLAACADAYINGKVGKL